MISNLIAQDNESSNTRDSTGDCLNNTLWESNNHQPALYRIKS